MPEWIRLSKSDKRWHLVKDGHGLCQVSQARTVHKAFDYQQGEKPSWGYACHHCQPESRGDMVALDESKVEQMWEIRKANARVRKASELPKSRLNTCRDCGQEFEWHETDTGFYRVKPGTTVPHPCGPSLRDILLRPSEAP